MKYYCIKQHDITDCGAACLATVSKQYGLNLSISKIREAAGTDKQGTNAYGMIKAAEQLGFSAKGVKGDQNAFFSEFPLPAIAHVVVNGSLLHYVVIHKITKKKYLSQILLKVWLSIHLKNSLKSGQEYLFFLYLQSIFRREMKTREYCRDFSV